MTMRIVIAPAHKTARDAVAAPVKIGSEIFDADRSATVDFLTKAGVSGQLTRFALVNYTTTSD